MPILNRKRRRKVKESSVRDGARLTRVRQGDKKEKASSGPNEAAAGNQSVHMVVEHGVDKPTHSVLELAVGAVPRTLLFGKRGMSFAAVGTRYGPRIVGLGQQRTTIYDPKTSMEVWGPCLVDPKLHPILIPHGSNLYALSSSPSVVKGMDFLPWFVVLNLNVGYIVGGATMGTEWRDLPPPPIFPCRLNPLEYRNPPKVRVASYALVGSHIVLSVQQDKGTCTCAGSETLSCSFHQQDKGTCAFNVDTKEWEMVDDKSLPFTGKAVPLGDHLFIACSKARAGVAAVYYMDVLPPTISGTGKTQLSIHELPVSSKGIVPGQLLCAMGKGSFSSFDIRSVDPGLEAKLEKARIVHRTYSQSHGGDNSVVMVKQQRQIFKLRVPSHHLAHPLPVVAALTMTKNDVIF
ncbi:hypothetical protein QOZ80_6AG0540610 [Eleusine coracana subsp. coracana]|nr:hypothetical protein QOZ80_6AG0540610 [Eleusine coracana subsp. coracana]